jgi:hypothetical protein
VQHGKEISLLEVSVHHNLILLACSDRLSIYDYEYLRLLGEAQFEQEINVLLFIGQLNVIAVGAHELQFLRFSVRDQQEI